MKKRIVILLSLLMLCVPVFADSAQSTLDEVIDDSLDGNAGDSTGEDWRLTAYANWGKSNLNFTELYGFYTDAEIDAALALKADNAFTPTGNITSVTIPLAIAELDSKKQATNTLNTAISNNTDVIINSAKGDYDSTTSARLANTSGTNTGDQDLSGKQDDLDVPSQAEAEAGSATTERVWTAQRISQAIAALAPGGVDEIVYQADCSGVTNGFCIDTDDGNLYFYNGTTIEAVSAAMTYPSGTGIPYVSAGVSWGTTLTYATLMQALDDLTWLFANPITVPGIISSAADGAHYSDVINTVALTSTATLGRYAFLTDRFWIANGSNWTTRYFFDSSMTIPETNIHADIARDSEVEAKYISGTENDYMGSLVNPTGIYAIDSTNHAVTIDNITPAAFTITEISIACNVDPTTELTLTFYHKAAGIGYGTPTTIEAVTTTAGVATIISGFDDATIPAGVKVFVTLSDPDAALLECAWKLEGDFD